MPQYEFTGTVKKLLPTYTAPSGFTKREVVVTSEGERFPQDISFEFVKERIALLDNVQEADRVKITFDLRGREYNSRYYVSVSAWKLEKVDGQGAAAAGAAAPAGGANAVSDPDALDERMPF
jgi:hypothetical protein